MVTTYKRLLTGAALFVSVHAYAMEPQGESSDHRDLDGYLNTVASDATAEQQGDEIMAAEHLADVLISKSAVEGFESRDHLIDWMKQLPPKNYRDLSRSVLAETRRGGHRDAGRAVKLLVQALDKSVQAQKESLLVQQAALTLAGEQRDALQTNNRIAEENLKWHRGSWRYGIVGSCAVVVFTNLFQYLASRS